jgi:hypothetical protein
MQIWTFASCLAMTLASVAGKSGAMDSAKENFAKEFTCPDDRVEARVREDVTATQLAGRKEPAPPAVVAADPARLALWRKEQSEREERDNRDHVVEVRGCGHEQTYKCGYATQHASTSSPWMCVTCKYPAGITKW